VLDDLLNVLDRRLLEGPATTLDAWRRRDALAGREITWNGGTGTAAGVDDGGRLLVDVPGGERVALDAGEVHLGRLPAG
jgi:BirA family biotin operon repressor/biotin-[acetyl-CoA-carboxylase] ligase